MRKASTAILSQAKRIAEGWFSIPSHYVTVLEDVMDRTTGTEAHLWWQDPNQPNEGVAVSLAMPEGRLLEYEKFELDEPSALESSRQSAALSIDQQKKVAEVFLATYAPDYERDFPHLHVEFRKGVSRFTWSQSVAGWPLPDTGLRVDVDARGRVKAFIYKGKSARLPSPPARLRNREVALREAKRALEATLMLAHLHHDFYVIPKDGLGDVRLVYFIEGFWPIFADAGVSHQEHKALGMDNKTRRRIPLEASPEPVVLGTAAVEDFLSRVCDNLGGYPRREIETDGVRRTTWLRETSGEPIDGPKTYEQLLLQKFSSRAAHMVVDGASGRLLSFIRFDDELEGQSSTREPLCWSYAACRNKAVSFVQHVFPDAHRFLVLVETERENLQPVRLAAHHQSASETPNGNPNEIFQFEAYVDGLPIYMAGWTVGVRRTDGRIVSYMGSETHPSIFLTTPKTPRITREQAIARVAAELDVRLEWYRDPTSGQDDFTLIYRPHVPQGTIRFIDAISGEPIRERNLS